MNQIIFIFTPLENTTGAAITDSLSTLLSRTRLAEAMAAPIRRNLNYSGIGRALFNVDPIPDLDPNRYNVPAANDPFGAREARERRNRQRFLPRQNTGDTYQPAEISTISRRNHDDMADANAATLRSIQGEEDRRIFDTILSIAAPTSSDGVDIEMLSTASGVPEGETIFHNGSSIVAGVDKFLTEGFRT